MHNHAELHAKVRLSATHGLNPSHSVWCPAAFSPFFIDVYDRGDHQSQLTFVLETTSAAKEVLDHLVLLVGFVAVQEDVFT